MCCIINLPEEEGYIVLSNTKARNLSHINLVNIKLVILIRVNLVRRVRCGLSDLLSVIAGRLHLFNTGPNFICTLHQAIIQVANITNIRCKFCFCYFTNQLRMYIKRKKILNLKYLNLNCYCKNFIWQTCLSNLWKWSHLLTTKFYVSLTNRHLLGSSARILQRFSSLFDAIRSNLCAARRTVYLGTSKIMIITLIVSGWAKSLSGAFCH